MKAKYIIPIGECKKQKCPMLKGEVCKLPDLFPCIKKLQDDK